jgi:hypothetical protein
MRASVVFNAAGGLLLATGIVSYFSPAPASFWGNSFIGIPYQLAQIAVPLSAGACAAIGSYLVRRKWANPTKLWVRAALISCSAFGIYALLHTFAYTAFAIVRYSTYGELPFVLVEGLVVESQHVVPSQRDTADRWSAAQAGVRSVPIVAM